MEEKNDNEINDDKFVRKKESFEWEWKGRNNVRHSKKGKECKREGKRENETEKKMGMKEKSDTTMFPG